MRRCAIIVLDSVTGGGLKNVNILKVCHDDDGAPRTTPDVGHDMMCMLGSYYYYTLRAGRTEKNRRYENQILVISTDVKRTSVSQQAFKT